jgi:type II secretory pathway pseudopilin PulG
VSILVFTTINPVAQYQRANDSRRKNDLGQIQKALEAYYQDNGNYPLSSIDNKIVNQSGTSVNWGGPWLPYMSKVPTDPSDTKQYIYYSVNGQSYWIYASLDRGDIDPAACDKGNKCGGVPVGAVCGAGICNYGVSSANVSP